MRLRSWFCCLVIIVACAPFEAPSPSESMVDVPLAWEFERRWAIGGAADTALQLATTYPSDLGADSAGHLWVIDRSEGRVVEYDGDGRRVRTLGGAGRGPGEFRFPISIRFSPTGAIRVHDVQKRSTVVFAADGAVLPEEKPDPRMRDPITLANGDLVSLRYTPDSSTLRTLANGELRDITGFAPPGQRPIPDACDLVGQTAPPVFSPTLEFAARGQRAVYTTGDFALTVYEPGQPLRVLTRAVPRRIATDEMARQHLGPGLPVQILGRPLCYVPADIILAAVGTAPEVPAYSRLIIAPDERIWAIRFALRDEPQVADIYHPQRGYQGTVRLGRINPVTFLSDVALISLEADNDDVPLVVAYLIRRR
jgi:hypothetical protein